MSPIVILVLLSLASKAIFAHGTNGLTHLTPYQLNDLVKMECPTIDNEGNVVTSNDTSIVWGKGPTCAETNEELQFVYGQDAMARCIWAIDDRLYKYLRKVVSGTAQYQCRIPLSKDKELYIPFVFSLWGLAEDTHIHYGFFLGASAYSLRDQFNILFPGTMIIMHGPVRWFLGHSFDSLTPKEETITFIMIDGGVRQDDEEKDKPKVIKTEEQEKAYERLGGGTDKVPITEVPTLRKIITSVPKSLVFTYVLISSGVTFGVCTLIYIGILKPAIISQYRKKK